MNDDGPQDPPAEKPFPGGKRKLTWKGRKAFYKRQAGGRNPKTLPAVRWDGKVRKRPPVA